MKRWRPLIVRGSLLLMESIWVYAAVALFVAITVGGGKPSFFGAAAVVIASFAISRALQNSNMSLGVVRAWGVLLSLLVFYAIVRIDFYHDLRLWDFSFADDLFNHTEASLRNDATAVLGIPLLWAFWMRGVLRGQQSIGFEDVVRSFAIGIIVVAFAVLFAGRANDLPKGVSYVAVPYLAIGLMAIGLAHASRAADEFEREFSSTWLMLVGGGLLLLALFALMFVLIDFSTAKDGLILMLRGVGFVVAGVFYVVLWPVLKAVELGFNLIRWLTALYGGQKTNPQDFSQGQQQPQPNQGHSGIPGWVGLMVRVIVAGGLLSVVVIGLALLFARFKKTQKPGELKESTYQEGRLASDLGNLLGSVFGRFRGRPAPPQLEPVRRLYFDMLQAGVNRGVERRPMETPLELAPRLGRTFGPQLPNQITQIFDDVRYGSRSPTEADVQQLRGDWDALPK
ncbi:MAG TPA: DUF4129 domain-containing protein [Dehalococcoidia bacterium]|nr:DUF4129 domain-containing protein [Dehalococcoidia bacterium]